MIRYAVRRLLAAVPLVLGIATVIFFILNLAPGDPAARYIGPSVPPEVVEQIRANLGLADPVHIRYLKWVGALFTGDFGYSLAKSRPVADLIVEILPNTLLLSGTALLLAFAAGILLGVVQAVRQYSVTDQVLSVVALFFYSMPSFWLALMLILLFSLGARSWDWPIWFPASGMQSVDFAFRSIGGQVADVLRHLTLPALSLALVAAAGIARYMRGSMLEVIRQDYIRTARAKGLPERSVIFKHALRNALGPVITLLGLYLPVLFSGTVFVEVVFGWPGMGSLIVEAIGQRDYPVVMGSAFIFGVLVVAGNLLSDLLYAVADPRIRYG